MKKWAWILFVGLSLPVYAATLPYFGSLRATQINLRTGPGERFPIQWVYTKPTLPVEIIDEFDVWYKIKEKDETQGWVHKTMLSTRRTALTTADQAVSVYKKKSFSSPVIAVLKGEFIVNLLSCPKAESFCLIQVQGIKGWVQRKNLWGLYPNEEVK
ncbi:MAG: hypothetical protein ILP11_04630 [Alphaproteobacteria bacterium]|nr:hypothetical protein [Alphaproteobacteria bacterium]